MKVTISRRCKIYETQPISHCKEHAQEEINKILQEFEDKLCNVIQFRKIVLQITVEPEAH